MPADEPRSAEELVRALERSGITDRRVLAAIAAVPRDRFVPAHLADKAWWDVALPIGARQTISQPYVVAFMTEALDVGEDRRVLEIGTGSGYQAAILARLAREVYSVERIPELGARACDTLAALDISNVHIRIGDGRLGWPEAAPFDRIIVTAAADEPPSALLDQLAEGGIMVIPLKEEDEERLVRLKRSDGRIAREPLLAVRFVPLV